MFRPIYLKAAAALLIYSILSKAVFASSLIRSNLIESLLYPMVFGMVSSCVFLYIFSHDDFIKIAKEIEKKEERSEKSWLKRMRHTSKIVSTLIIGTLAGPILSAFTTRILLINYKYKYPLVVFINIPSTLFSVGLAKELISFIR